MYEAVKVKDYLNGYRRSLRRIRQLEEQEETIRTAVSSAKSQQILDMPRGGKGNSLDDIVRNDD